MQPNSENGGEPLLVGRVLVLNRLWQAVNIINIRRAITILYSGRCLAIDRNYVTHDWTSWLSHSTEMPRGKCITGVSVRLQAPRVVQLVAYDRLPQPLLRFTRANLYLRDSHRCQYCSRQASSRELTLDHVVPRSHGGTTNWKNVVTACGNCNLRKGDRAPEDVGLKLYQQLRRPEWRPAMLRELQAKTSTHDDWLSFLIIPRSLIDSRPRTRLIT